jgi:hypothetical protein
VVLCYTHTLVRSTGRLSESHTHLLDDLASPEHPVGKPTWRARTSPRLGLTSDRPLKGSTRVGGETAKTPYRLRGSRAVDLDDKRQKDWGSELMQKDWYPAIYPVYVSGAADPATRAVTEILSQQSAVSCTCYTKLQ